MRRIITIVFTLIMTLSFLTACSDNFNGEGIFHLNGHTSDETLESTSYDIGFGDDTPRTTILEYLKAVGNEPLILYRLNDTSYSKSSKIEGFYVITNGWCRKYTVRDLVDFYYHEENNYQYTLGQMSKMTDEEILNMLNDTYASKLQKAISYWRKFDKDTLKLYNPSHLLPIEGCLLTDGTGNMVEQEILFFPVAGIDDNPYVFERKEETSQFRYYSSPDDHAYFSTGYGTVNDINIINDLICISNQSITTGTVYQSTYYGFRLTSSDWTHASSGIICFRDENAYTLNLTLDNMSSDAISYIDPTENEMINISQNYYRSYYRCFDDMASVIDTFLK